MIRMNKKKAPALDLNPIIQYTIDEKRVLKNNVFGISVTVLLRKYDDVRYIPDALSRVTTLRSRGKPKMTANTPPNAAKVKERDKSSVVRKVLYFYHSAF